MQFFERSLAEHSAFALLQKFGSIKKIFAFNFGSFTEVSSAKMARTEGEPGGENVFQAQRQLCSGKDAWKAVSTTLWASVGGPFFMVLEGLGMS